jgi:uncharacterized protein YPO0396
VRKVAIRDSAFYGWLERELTRRFDYACCADLEAFRRERKAITRTGQIKTEGARHEKDDRHSLDDRTRYVLGWTNEAKVAALARQAEDLDRRIAVGRRQLASIRTEQKALREREGYLKQLLVYQEFSELDWRPLTLEVHRREEERRSLESASDLLRTLAEQLAAAEARFAAADADLQSARSEQAVAVNKRETAAGMLNDAQTLLAAMPEEAKDRYFPKLEAMRAEALGEHRLTVESCDNRQSDMREWLQGRIDAEEKRLQRLREAILSAMGRYKNDWPVETSEVDVSVEAAGEYRGMLQQLRADDLPRF